MGLDNLPDFLSGHLSIDPSVVSDVSFSALSDVSLSVISSEFVVSDVSLLSLM